MTLYKLHFTVYPHENSDAPNPLNGLMQLADDSFSRRLIGKYVIYITSKILIGQLLILRKTRYESVLTQAGWDLQIEKMGWAVRDLVAGSSIVEC